MTVVERSALVRYPAAAMFDLVDDIESYPEFLPWCESSRVLKREPTVVEAELAIARGGFRKTFATRNMLLEKGEIRMTLLEGPFDYLEGAWRFQALREDASKVSLNLEFELSSRLVGVAFGRLFNQICETMVGAFSERAKVVYG